MAVNVILTFDNIGGKYQDTQEFFDLKIPVKKSDTDVTAFLNKKFFPKIFEECIKNNKFDMDENIIFNDSDFFTSNNWYCWLTQSYEYK